MTTETVPVITARHDGRCPVCPDLIEGGRDRITRTDDGAWVHERCADDGPPPPRNALCPSCFIHHAGDCA